MCNQCQNKIIIINLGTEIATDSWQLQRGISASYVLYAVNEISFYEFN